MDTERLKDFPAKTAPTGDDILYVGDASDSFEEVKSTLSQLIAGYSAALASIAGLTTAANQMLYTTAEETYAVTAITEFARLLIAESSAGDVLTLLGVSVFMQAVLEAENAQEAATALEVLALSGGTMTGAINMGNQLITDLADPVSDQDAATRAYVDNAVQNIHAPCVVATTANLAGYTYDNGTAGVDATLSAGSNGAFSQDGQSPSLDDRILVAQQSSTFQNGIYTLTQVGDGSTPAILTRATDYDEPGDIEPGDKVTILSGTIYSGTEWIETATVTTIGTDPITFSQVVNNAYLTKANNLSDLASAATAFGNIKQAATTAATGVVQLADQAAQEAGTTGRAVTSDVQQYHPSAPKVWVKVAMDATTNGSYNVSSITDGGTGIFTINFTTAFTDTAYAVTNGLHTTSDTAQRNTYIRERATTTLRFTTTNQSETLSEDSISYVSIAIWGDQ